MTLDECLKKKQIKNIEMANALNLTQGFISKLRKKKANPTLFNAFLIMKYCDFEVSLPELVSQESFDFYMQKKSIPPFDLKQLIQK